MRVTTDFTRGYQVWLMIKRELIAVGVCAFVQFMLFINAYTSNIFRIISGVLFTLVHFMFIYDAASVLGTKDTKPYSPLKYDIKWSVLWGVLISLISLAFTGIFKLNWHFVPADGTFTNPVSIIINILFYIWQSPYLAFLIEVKGNVSPGTVPNFVILISVLLPIVASVLGYISGKNNFAISDKMQKLMFEKSDKDA